MTTRQDLIIRQGETWSHTFATGLDLTGYVARMAIRATRNGTAEAYLSTEADALGGSIALFDGAAVLSMTAEETAAIGGTDEETVLVYDLELVSGAGAVTRALEGRFVVLGEVTT